jgi:hypothetical protein
MSSEKDKIESSVASDGSAPGSSVILSDSQKQSIQTKTFEAIAAEDVIPFRLVVRPEGYQEQLLPTRRTLVRADLDVFRKSRGF